MQTRLLEKISPTVQKLDTLGCFLIGQILWSGIISNFRSLSGNVNHAYNRLDTMRLLSGKSIYMSSSNNPLTALHSPLSKMDVSTPGISPHAPASAPAFPLTEPVFAFPPPQIFKLPPGVLSPIPLQPAPKRERSVTCFYIEQYHFYIVSSLFRTIYFHI